MEFGERKKKNREHLLLEDTPTVEDNFYRWYFFIKMVP
jgi:hypothetical protein